MYTKTNDVDQILFRLQIIVISFFFSFVLFRWPNGSFRIVFHTEEQIFVSEFGTDKLQNAKNEIEGNAHH